MKVDIYIHGVPNGQRIWGTGGDDQVINQFYGAGSDEQTKFLAEVRKSGGQNYCYYSLLKYKNISAENGRAGSYFGLTIKMDMVCTKVKTVFQILDMIYSSAVLNTLLKKEGERLQYIVSDFKEKENQCKAIVDKIMAMLGHSVDGNDFVAITPSMLSGKGTSKYNISEYNSENAFVCISQNGSVAVSSDYPSTQLASYIKKKDAEVSNIKLQSQQDINRIQQQASQEMREQERRNTAALQQTREQANREIEQAKARYSDIDRKLAGYEQQIRQLQNANRELEKKSFLLEKDIKERDGVIAKLRRNTSGYTEPAHPENEPGIMQQISTRILPFVNLLIVVAVLSVLLLQMPSDNSKKVEQISNDLTELKEKMEKVDIPAVIDKSLENNEVSDVKRIDNENRKTTERTLTVQ